MLKQTSSLFRTLFLLQFTKELILHSKAGNVQTNQTVFFPARKPMLLQPRVSAQRRTLELPSQMQRMVPRRVMQKQMQTGTFIPEPRIPPTISDISPSPTNIDMDLEKLNPLVRDPAVKIIECNGVNQPLIVRGNMGTKPTNIFLNQEEIEDVIERFSHQAKIPVTEGIFKVAVGRLIITAVISEVVSSRFVIQKMVFPLNKLPGAGTNAMQNFQAKNR